MLPPLLYVLRGSNMARTCWNCGGRAKYAEDGVEPDYPHHVWHDISTCPNKIHSHHISKAEAWRAFEDMNCAPAAKMDSRGN